MPGSAPRPTDGTPAAQERARMLAAVVAPYSLARTRNDWAADGAARLAAGCASGLQLAMVFVLLVAACGPTVSVVTGLTERRRPFALLRASGVGMRELRRITAGTWVPMVVTLFAGVRHCAARGVRERAACRVDAARRRLLHQSHHGYDSVRFD